MTASKCTVIDYLHGLILIKERRSNNRIFSPQIYHTILDRTKPSWDASGMPRIQAVCVTENVRGKNKKKDGCEIPWNF